MPEPLIRYAQEFAELTLGDMPEALGQCGVAAAQAERATRVLNRPRPQVLISAAWLHGVGRAPDAVRSGLAAVDGANYLLSQGWPAPVVSLVAHQLQSRMIADAYQAADALALIERVQGWPADILDYAIVTSSTDGPVEVSVGLHTIRQQDIANPRVSATTREERQVRLHRAADRVNSALEAASSLD